MGVFTCGGVRVATMQDLGSSEREYSNAQLMAAAPMMLKVLEEISNRGVIPGYGSADALALRIVGTQSLARAAIAKATGEPE